VVQLDHRSSIVDFVIDLAVFEKIRRKTLATRSWPYLGSTEDLISDTGRPSSSYRLTIMNFVIERTRLRKIPAGLVT
jgi:hypothetical protein